MDIFKKLYTAGEFDNCFKELKTFNQEVNVVTIDQTDCLIPHLNKKIIGTYDDNKQPENDNELVVIIGDYPVGYDSLIHNNPLKRNYKWALNFNYDTFLGNSCWDNIDRFYILNLDEKKDRLFDILKQCKYAEIPLDKVTRFSAVKYTETSHYYINGSIGCSMSHLQILKDMMKHGYKNVVIFEDDFTFSDPIKTNQENIDKFFSRSYDYDVVLLATSTCKSIEKYDDLISISKQFCTTTSGYMISKQGAEKVIKIWETGLSSLLNTHSVRDYACDISWAQIQKDNKMFTFNYKMGYQRPIYSDITKRIAYNLD